MKKILVTNDDGIAAPGIKALTEVMHELGEIYIIAPDSAQSGMGHAITINSTLELKHIPNFLGTNNAYSCSGTPVDCVKMGVHEVMCFRCESWVQFLYKCNLFWYDECCFRRRY